MAYVYIEEYDEIWIDIRGNPVQMPGDLIASQRVTIGAASAQSAALNAATKWVVLTSRLPAQWAEGSNPTATSSDRLLPTDVPRPFKVTGGNKIAVIEEQA